MSDPSTSLTAPVLRYTKKHGVVSVAGAHRLCRTCDEVVLTSVGHQHLKEKHRWTCWACADLLDMPHICYKNCSLCDEKVFWVDRQRHLSTSHSDACWACTELVTSYVHTCQGEQPQANARASRLNLLNGRHPECFVSEDEGVGESGRDNRLDVLNAELSKADLFRANLNEARYSDGFCSEGGGACETGRDNGLDQLNAQVTGTSASKAELQEANAQLPTPSLAPFRFNANSINRFDDEAAHELGSGKRTVPTAFANLFSSMTAGIVDVRSLREHTSSVLQRHPESSSESNILRGFAASFDPGPRVEPALGQMSTNSIAARADIPEIPGALLAFVKQPANFRKYSTDVDFEYDLMDLEEGLGGL